MYVVHANYWAKEVTGLKLLRHFFAFKNFKVCDFIIFGMTQEVTF